MVFVLALTKSTRGYRNTPKHSIVNKGRRTTVLNHGVGSPRFGQVLIGWSERCQHVSTRAKECYIVRNGASLTVVY